MDDNSRGRALYYAPLRMLDPLSNLTSSLSSSFSFQISSSQNTSSLPYTGDGMAFLISPDNFTLGHYGKLLGAFTLENSPSNEHTFAVEFDTWLNPDIQDPNNNHVGLDLANISSTFFQNASNAGVILHDGSVLHAWIDYDGIAQNIQVRLSPLAIKPPQALINVNLSLSRIFNEYMYVGFSASTGSSNEMHTLLSWNFTIWGLPPFAKGKSRNSASIVAGILMSALVFSLFLGTLCWRFQRAKRRNSYFRRAAEYEHHKPAGNGLHLYTYKMLYDATKRFSHKERIGKGGFGNFYRGVLPDTGMAVAVKKACKNAEEGTESFLAEASFLSSLHHRNLVQLLGCSRDNGEVLLVYEFLPYGGLDGFLFDSRHEVLSWDHRYKIVTGIAAALRYLHEGCFEFQDAEQCILHRNVKASNVMLDHDFNAKLGDYGLASLMDHHNVAGTFGYIAPEAVETGKLTLMTDVFSFGALALEVACGRHALEGSMETDKAVLVDWVWRLHREERILDAADKRLQGCFDIQEMRCLLNVGLLCSHSDPSVRPSMNIVEQILTGEASLPLLTSVTDHKSDVPSISIKQLLDEFNCSSEEISSFCKHIDHGHESGKRKERRCSDSDFEYSDRYT